jgi:hypothetical protein
VTEAVVFQIARQSSSRPFGMPDRRVIDRRCWRCQPASNGRPAPAGVTIHKIDLLYNKNEKARSEVSGGLLNSWFLSPV